MKKIRDGVRMIRLFLRLVFEMIKNYPLLNDDPKHNFLTCKKICRKVIKSANIQLHVYDKQNIPSDDTFLLVSNHRCFFDVVFLLASIDQAISFVAAKELYRYPVLRKYLASIQCVSLDRYTNDIAKIKKSIADMKTVLEQGNLVLFPEGECSYHERQMKKFKKGGFMGVTGLDVPILPAFLKIDEIRNIGRWMIPQGDVSVFFGKTFYPAEVSEKRRQAGELAAFAQCRVREMQEMAEGKLL